MATEEHDLLDNRSPDAATNRDGSIDPAGDKVDIGLPEKTNKEEHDLLDNLSPDAVTNGDVSIDPAAFTVVSELPKKKKKTNKVKTKETPHTLSSRLAWFFDWFIYLLFSPLELCTLLSMILVYCRPDGLIELCSQWKYFDWLDYYVSYWPIRCYFRIFFAALLGEMIVYDETNPPPRMYLPSKLQPEEPKAAAAADVQQQTTFIDSAAAAEEKTDVVAAAPAAAEPVAVQEAAAAATDLEGAPTAVQEETTVDAAAAAAAAAEARAAVVAATALRMKSMKAERHEISAEFRSIMIDLLSIVEMREQENERENKSEEERRQKKKEEMINKIKDIDSALAEAILPADNAIAAQKGQ